MPSTNKTPFLKLNSWLGTDKPKREDFNADNQKIDDAVKDHFEDTQVHLSAAERALWNSGAFVMGTYTGTGTQSRTIETGFSPRFGIVFGDDVPVVQTLFIPKQTQSHIGFFSQEGCSTGCAVQPSGFKVWSTEENTPDGIAPHLNAEDVKYIYILYR